MADPKPEENEPPQPPDGGDEITAEDEALLDEWLNTPFNGYVAPQVEYGLCCALLIVIVLVVVTLIFG